MYDIVPKDKYGNQFKPTGKLFNLKINKRDSLSPGDEYLFKSGLFHESVNKEGLLTATIIKKTSVDEDVAVRVIGVKDFDPKDNEFDRTKINQDVARHYLEEVLLNTNQEILSKAYEFCLN